LLNMPLIEGMRLMTLDGAEAEAEFEDGSTVRLAPGTGMIFTDLGLRDSGARVTTVTITAGTAYFDLLKAQNDEFRVRFGGEDILIDHPVRFRAEVDQNQARLAVFKGELNFEGDTHSVRVKKNETITLDFSDPAHYMLANVIQPGPFDSWNNDRERFRTQYSTASSYITGPNPNYFFSDLSYYGSTVFVPGYGYVWRPYGIGAGWDPFSNGSWAWYPGYGYTFVSGYPWGWRPYRYGYWCFIPGYGWGWQPGNNWNTWNTVPVVTTTPPGWKRPTPPVWAGPGRPVQTVVMGGPGANRPDGEPGPVLKTGDHTGAGAGFIGGSGTGTTPLVGGVSGGSTTIVTMPSTTSTETTRGVIPDRRPRGEPSTQQRPTASGNAQSHAGDGGFGRRDAGTSRPTASENTRPTMSMSHSEASRPSPPPMAAPSVSMGSGAVHSGGGAKPKQ
jgi:hypothetical protein